MNATSSGDYIYTCKETDSTCDITPNQTNSIDGEVDNYIWFNNEMWRIIGSIPTKQTSGETINLVKIIRTKSIGGYAYHPGNRSEYTIWGSNTLYTLLNSYYYGKKDATGGDPCYGQQYGGYSLCNYGAIGISNNSNDYYGRMVKRVYWNVGIVSGTISSQHQIYTKEISNQTTLGYVGLMNLSDYEYSVGTGRSYADCPYSWLCGSGSEWTMNSDGDISPNFIRGSGTSSNLAMRNSSNVRPVVYLDDSVYVVSGDGSATSPYTLFME